MPMYLGSDGQIYNRHVPGSTRIDTGTVTPPRPPHPRDRTPAPPPPSAEAGFFRKALFWMTSLGSTGAMGYAAGTFLSTSVLADVVQEGFLGNISTALANSAPVILCLIAVIACFVCGLGAGEEHNYNLAALIITVFSTAATCVLGGLLLALLPYGLALVGYLFVGALIIGVIASLFGG